MSWCAESILCRWDIQSGVETFSRPYSKVLKRQTEHLLVLHFLVFFYATISIHQMASLCWIFSDSTLRSHQVAAVCSAVSEQSDERRRYMRGIDSATLRECTVPFKQNLRGRMRKVTVNYMTLYCNLTTTKHYKLKKIILKPPEKLPTRQQPVHYSLNTCTCIIQFVTPHVRL